MNTDLLIFAGSAVLLYMTCWYLLGLLLKRYDLVDIAWGLGFVMVAWIVVLFEPGASVRLKLLTGLVTVWGIRLSLHIFLRNKDKKEDYRYANWRKEWGRYHALRAYFQVFLLQGLLMLLISAPLFLVGFSADTPLNALDYAGTAVWTLGFFFEAVGDYQLILFKKDPSNKGKIMTSGLWRYTRHPNYFGEVTQWWGIFLIALSVNNGVFTVISPLLITFLILKVSGIPMLEKKYEDDPDFQAYKERTSVFFPLPPKDR